VRPTERKKRDGYVNRHIDIEESSTYLISFLYGIRTLDGRRLIVKCCVINIFNSLSITLN